MHESQKARALEKAREKPGKAVFACFERKQGWKAALPIYVLWCSRCKRSTETHPAGYGRITCDTCRYTARVQTWQRFRDKQAPSLLGYAIFIGTAMLAAAIASRGIHGLLGH